MFDFDLNDFNNLIGLFNEAGSKNFTLRKTFNKVEGFSEEDESEIMIRVNKEFITLARINILETRNGTGTKIFNFLIDYCKKNNKEKLIFESVFTDEMINFCKKYNLKPDKFAFRNSKGNIIGNYELYL